MLTITAGTRHYSFDNKFNGSVTSSFDCFEQGVPAGGCINGGTNLDAKNLSFKESGFKSRAQYHLARHAGRHGLRDLVAGISPGRFQPPG